MSSTSTPSNINAFLFDVAGLLQDRVGVKRVNIDGRWMTMELKKRGMINPDALKLIPTNRQRGKNASHPRLYGREREKCQPSSS